MFECCVELNRFLNLKVSLALWANPKEFRLKQIYIKYVYFMGSLGI